MFPNRNLALKASNVAKLPGKCFACHRAAGPSNVMPNPVTLDRSASGSISLWETWLASHVLRNACTHRAHLGTLGTDTASCRPTDSPALSALCQRLALVCGVVWFLTHDMKTKKNNYLKIILIE